MLLNSGSYGVAWSLWYDACNGYYEQVKRWLLMTLSSVPLHTLKWHCCMTKQGMHVVWYCFDNLHTPLPEWKSDLCIPVRIIHGHWQRSHRHLGFGDNTINSVLTVLQIVWPEDYKLPNETLMAFDWCTHLTAEDSSRKVNGQPIKER